MDTDKRIEKIKEVLPHGSGINDRWDIEIKKKTVICKNSYDFMTEHGYYDGNFPFTVTFTQTDMKFHFNGLTRSQYKKIEREDLRPYLEETLYEAYEPIKQLLKD